MILRTIRSYRAEVSRAIRLRHTWVGPVMLLAAVGLAPLVRPVLRDGRSDYDFIAQVTPATLNLLGFLLLISWCACLVASEIGSGSIRMILARPIHRRDYLLGKFLAGCSYAVLLTTLTGAVAWAIAWLFGELQGVAFGGELVHTSETMMWAYLTGAALSLLPMCAGVACALLGSVCTRHSGAAVSLTVGFWLVLDMVKHPLGIDQWVFTTYLETPWQVFISRCDGLDAAWWPMAGWCAGTSAATTILMLAAAMLVLRLRNLSG